MNFGFPTFAKRQLFFGPFPGIKVHKFNNFWSSGGVNRAGSAVWGVGLRVMGLFCEVMKVLKLYYEIRVEKLFCQRYVDFYGLGLPGVIELWGKSKFKNNR